MSKVAQLVSDSDFITFTDFEGKVLHYYPGVYPNSGGKTYTEQCDLLRENEFVLNHDEALACFTENPVPNVYFRTATKQSYFQKKVGIYDGILYMTVHNTDRITFVSIAVGLRI